MLGKAPARCQPPEEAKQPGPLAEGLGKCGVEMWSAVGAAQKIFRSYKCNRVSGQTERLGQRELATDGCESAVMGTSKKPSLLPQARAQCSYPGVFTVF